MAELRVRLFGQPTLEVDGVPRRIRRRKVAALLAYLAMSERPRSRDELAELLYPRTHRNRAYAGLRQTLCYLRSEIGDEAVEAAPRSIALEPDGRLALDVSEFRRHVAQARGPRELVHLREAVSLYRGAFLEGFYLRDSPYFEEWQYLLADELRGEYASALLRLHDLYFEQGSLDQSVDCARSIVALDALDEVAQRRLMRTLAAAGRQRDAMRQFESFRARLARELEAEPEEETRALIAEIRASPDLRPAARRGEGRPEKGARSGQVVVGVLPFDNLSEEPGQAYFCDGLSEDLTTALTAVPRLKVVARNTMFGYKGKSADAQQLGRNLGVTHLLEGSVRKAGKQVRINVQLVETQGGGNLWAKKFDRELGGIFEIQDDIVHSVLTELDVRLVAGEQARLWGASTGNAEAYDLFLRSRDQIASPEGWARAVALLDQALALDPDFVAALCHKAFFRITQAQIGWVDDPQEAMRQARQTVERALRLDDRCSEAHAGHGMLLFAEKRFAEAEAEYEKAIALGPTMEYAHSICAAFYTTKKDHPKALWHVRRAKELSRAPHSQTYAWEIVCLRNLGRLEEALAVAREALELFPGGIDILVNYANVCRMLERREELEAAIERIVEIQPDFSIERWMANTGLNPKELAHYVAALKRAGFP